MPDPGLIFPAQPPVTLPIEGTAQRFPVHRIYCVGRNYAEHTREMGFDPVREEPFFFQKNPDALIEYAFNTGTAKHRFCRHCGIKSFYVPRSNPDGIDVNVRCLDPRTIERVEVTAFDDTRRHESEAAIVHLSRRDD